MHPQAGDYLRKGLHAIERGITRTSLRIKHRMGWFDPIRILPYRGFGNRTSGEILGRVLENRDIRPPKDNDPWWRNAAAVVRRFITAEVPDIRIHGRFRGQPQVVTTDEEGYFKLRFRCSNEQEGAPPSGSANEWTPVNGDGTSASHNVPPSQNASSQRSASSLRSGSTSHSGAASEPFGASPGDDGGPDSGVSPASLAPPELWEAVDITLLDRLTADDLVFAAGRILVPPDAAQFGVISDIDDTILETYATEFFRMARLTLFNNAYTRTPFRKVAPFYRALQSGTRGTGPNPIFYVSSSAWNLYDLLDDFMRVHGIPEGPILLRDLGFHRHNKALKSRHDHKLDKIDDIMNYYPNLPFVLIGDSGQRDPYIYQEVVRRHPGRIAAIYIRDVRDRTREQVLSIAEVLRGQGVDMLLIDDASVAARHAASIGLIARDSLPEIVEAQ